MTRVLIISLCAWLVGCASSTGTGTGGGGGSGGGSGACNSLVNNAPMVSKNVNAGPAPVMTGGTVADGTWFLTRMDRYNGSTGSSTHKETWVFSGSSVQIVTFKSTDSTQKQYSATWSTTGNMATLTVNCPSSMTLNSPFTATATTLQVINDGDPNEMHTFTRQ